MIIGIYAIFVIILVGVIAGWAFRRLDARLVGPMTLVVTVLGIFLASVQREASRRPAGEVAPALASELAPQVRADWTDELLRRGLEYGRRIGVRWRRTAGSNPTTELADALPEEGTLGQLIDFIGSKADQGRLPRLVVTGEMGSGKTAACVLLVVELAGRHTNLPVLFQLAAWNPSTSLRTWMAAQLPESIPALGETEHGRDVANMLANRHILPILDGLDEMSEPTVALNRIDNEPAGRPFVLTCRTKDFNQANAGYVLHQSLVIELQPLDPSEAADILHVYEPDGSPLASLAQKLREEPGGPVAAALSTPFMVALARDSGASLADLLPAADTPDAVDRIRRHLLGAFIRKAYANDDNITPDQARRYLLFLAGHTDEAGRIAWWRLHKAVPRLAFFVIALFIALAVCSGLAAMFFALFDRPWLGFWIGLTAGALGASVVEFIPQGDPRRARPRLRAIRVPELNEMPRILGFGIIGAVTLATMAWILYRPFGYAVIGGVLSGFTFAVARYVSQPNDPLKVLTPLTMLRADRVAVLIALLTGAIAGAFTGFYLGYSFRVGHRPGFDTLPILRQPTLVLALIGAFGGFVLSSAGLGLMAAGSSSWARFILTRTWLAAQGALPFRLMHFLEDAYYYRGVLRQVNGYYEFRHSTLQRYLAEPNPDSSMATAPS